MKLIDDPDHGVRYEAYQALAEFPSLNSESILLPKLASDFPPQVMSVAYALHSGSSNALLHLLTVARDSTNRPSRIAALGALAFRDEVSNIETASEAKGSLYQKKWLRYSQRVTMLSMRLLSSSPDQSQFELIRSNILSTGLPRVYETLGPAKPPLSSPNPQPDR